MEENKNVHEPNINKINNEESILKTLPGNSLELIKNEYKPSEENINNEIIDIDEIKSKKVSTHKCQLYKYVGRTLFVFLDKYSNPLFIIGPHWPVFICLTTLVSSIMIYFYLKYWSVFGFKTKLLGDIIFWTFILSYTYTSLINPGYPRNTLGRSIGIPKNDYYYCEYCGFYLRKCAYASHCDLCQICIEKHDHHCIWTGHCIGKNNKITFFIFLISVFCLTIYFAYAFYEAFCQSLK